MITWFKSPLTIYVAWHPDYADGQFLGDRLFEVLSRNVGDPFARTPGIPVFFRSSPATSDSKDPRAIPFEESEYTAIVVLVDDHMVVSDQWGKYVGALDDAAAKSEGKVRLFPVAVNPKSFGFPVANTNFIRLFEVQAEQLPVPPDGTAAPPRNPAVQKSSGEGDGVTINIFIDNKQAESIRVERGGASEMGPAAAPEGMMLPTKEGGGLAEAAQTANNDRFRERQATFLIGKLVHELSRMLYHQPRMTEEGTVQSAPPIRMFISHAKADGAEVAAAIRNHIHSDTSLNSFFDANDIAVGYRFSDELLGALEESAMICLQTDHYATREWCLWEVINAKRMDRPVVVVNAVTDREPRSFPYIGNVPTIRWHFDHEDDREQIQEVLDLTLFEVLGTRFRELFQTALLKTFELPEDTGVVGHPPELFTILKMASDGSSVKKSREGSRYLVYPDPPLGDEELRLLQELAPDIQLVTPTMLPLVQHQLKTK